VTGDPAQHDLPLDARSGLNDALTKLDRVEEIGVVRFTEQDIVRHPLVERILRAYNGAVKPKADGELANGKDIKTEGGDG
jgi:phosphate starvation-inducible PhoH-like protein